jgi:Flp pilus assembly protein CpaB
MMSKLIIILGFIIAAGFAVLAMLLAAMWEEESRSEWGRKHDPVQWGQPRLLDPLRRKAG